MIARVKLFASSIFLYFLSCQNHTEKSERNKEYILADSAIKDSCRKWGKLDLYNKNKFGLYCIHASDESVKRTNLNGIIKLDTIPYYKMDLYAYNAKYYNNDTFDIDFQFYDDTTSFYLYSSIHTMPLGLVLKGDSIIKFKDGSDFTMQEFSKVQSLHKDFYKDTLMAFEIFNKNKGRLNNWLKLECLKKGIFSNN